MITGAWITTKAYVYWLGGDVQRLTLCYTLWLTRDYRVQALPILISIDNQCSEKKHFLQIKQGF